MDKALVTKKVKSNEKNKEIALILIKYTSFFIVFYFLSIAKINNLIPFWFGLFVALALIRQNIIVLSAMLMLSSFLASLQVNSLIIAGNMVLVFIIATQIHKKINKKISLAFAGLYSVLGNVAYFYFNIGSSESILSAGISVLLGLIFTFSCIIIINAIVGRNYAFKLNVDEAICAGVVVMALMCGFSAVQFFGFDIAKMISVLLVLVLSFVSPIFATLGGVAMGLGIAFGTNIVGYIACLTLMGLFASIFKTNNRIFSIISVLVIEVLFGLYFNVFPEYGVLSAVSALTGCLIYILIPTGTLNLLNKNFVFLQNTAVKNIYNQNRELVSKKLFNVSEVFFEMDKVFRKFVRGALPAEDAKKMLSAELLQSCCEDCKEKNRCLRSLGTEMGVVLDGLFNIGFEKGKITILDLPPFLTSRCAKTNQLVNSTNSLISQYKQYTNVINNLDNSKILVADQLCSVSKILKNISEELNSPIAFDSIKESKIVEELTYKNIICKEVAVYEQNKNIVRVSLVVRNSDLENDEILKTVNNVCKCSMKIENISPSKVSGLTTIDYKVMSKYDVVLGLAGANKNGSDISGDCHSLERLNDNKFMLAVCDGMGSGEDAEKISNLTISMVENFYKANYDSETIISSVNKLVSLNSGDRFSALDVCVLDLSDGIADFIKLGACEGYIKHKESVTIIPSGALPLGILEEVEPKITKTALSGGDMVIVVSDGITDAFKEEDIQNFINNINTLNPQVLAENILDKATVLNGGLPKDDMTVLVGKIYAT